MGAKQRGANRGKKAAAGSMKGAPKSQKQLNQSVFGGILQDFWSLQLTRP